MITKAVCAGSNSYAYGWAAMLAIKPPSDLRALSVA
jgi:hypothetical protein